MLPVLKKFPEPFSCIHSLSNLFLRFLGFNVLYIITYNRSSGGKETITAFILCVEPLIKVLIFLLPTLLLHYVFSLYLFSYLDDKTSPQFQFQNQQFWSAVKVQCFPVLHSDLKSQDCNVWIVPQRYPKDYIYKITSLSPFS